MKRTKIHALMYPIAFLLALLMPAATYAADNSPAQYRPDITFTLRTAVAEGKLVYIGVGGNIDGKVNPDLRVAENAVVQINLVDGDGAMHDISLPDFDATSDRVTSKGSSTVLAFRAKKNGEFYYFCTVPGHRAAGMEGKLIVGKAQKSTNKAAPDLSRDPNDTGTPVGDRQPTHKEFTLNAVEKEGRLEDGTNYRFWTFNGKIPGPLLRVRVGDTVTVHLHNDKSSTMIHSVDMHAVTGPGGGAAVNQTAPGDTRSFTFTALKPGLFVYHCATPMVAHHIANGMFGMVLVEPAGGLPKVDQEFYIMQSEVYTNEKHGSHGDLSFSLDKLLDEDPEYYIFNGATDALTRDHRMAAKVGDEVRIFFGDGGPNATSSFHVIGEILDRVYDQASLVSPPLKDVQTTTVAPGGATMVEFKVDYPGRYIVVDHALSRMERGLAGYLYVDGKKDDNIFKPLD